MPEPQAVNKHSVQMEKFTWKYVEEHWGERGEAREGERKRGTGMCFNANSNDFVPEMYFCVVVFHNEYVTK